MGFLCFLFNSFFLLSPHGDLQLRIDEISQSIALYPDSIPLYLSRGELYLQHEEFGLAHQDFSFCLQHGMQNARVFEGMSKSLEDPIQRDSAIYYIDLALVQDPHSPSAVTWKARLLYLSGQFCGSAQLYEKIILQASAPSPSLYIDGAHSWTNCTEQEGIDRAIDILKKGLLKIGSLHVLQKELVQTYLVKRDFQNALLTQTELIDHTTSKTTPLFDRAMIYVQLGDFALAQQDLNDALLAFNQLPGYKQSIPAMQELKHKIEHQLGQLKG